MLPLISSSVDPDRSSSFLTSLRSSLTSAHGSLSDSGSYPNPNALFSSSRIWLGSIRVLGSVDLTLLGSMGFSLLPHWLVRTQGLREKPPAFRISSTPSSHPNQSLEIITRRQDVVHIAVLCQDQTFFNHGW